MWFVNFRSRWRHDPEWDCWSWELRKLANMWWDVVISIEYIPQTFAIITQLCKIMYNHLLGFVKMHFHVIKYVLFLTDLTPALKHKYSKVLRLLKDIFRRLMTADRKLPHLIVVPTIPFRASIASSCEVSRLPTSPTWWRHRRASRVIASFRWRGAVGGTRVWSRATLWGHRGECN